MNDTELIREMKRMEDSGIFDVLSLDNIIQLLERTVPDNFRLVVSAGKQMASTEFREKVEGLVLPRLGDSGTTPESKEKVRLSVEFFSLIAIVRLGADTMKSSPSFVPNEDFATDIQKLLSEEPSLRVEPEVDVHIEAALRSLCHKHDAARKGLFNSQRAEETYDMLSFLWTSSPEFTDWLVPYLTFRLSRNLANVDLFYAMHSRLPHYRELKILAYLLQFLGRGKYTPIGQFAELSLEAYYEILNKCSSVFSGQSQLEKLQGVVSNVLVGTQHRIREVDAAARATKGEDVPSLTVRVSANFFDWYFQELSETGTFHVVLWSLPMFKEAKEAFRSVAKFRLHAASVLLIGETGTGKESIAKLFLRTLGEPYVAVDCAGMTWDRLYDDLFASKEGESPLVDRINAILLDELDRAQLDTQGQLLRLLDKPYGECRKPGQLTAVRWHGLTVATTTDHVYERMKNGSFLPDLFWRFDIRAHISPLKDKASCGESFEELFQLAVELSRRKLGFSAPIALQDKQLERLREYEWPGNLREMLEFADSLVTELLMGYPAYAARLKADSRSVDRIEVPDDVFKNVMYRYQFCAYRISQ